MGLPFRSGHLLAPTLVWLIADTSATFDGVDLGDIGPAPTPGELGEFRIPQRGIFAIGRALFDPRPSRQQEDQVTIRPRRPNEPENHGARRREMVRAEGLPQAPDGNRRLLRSRARRPVGTCRRRRLHPRADREGGTGARPRRVPADHVVEAYIDKLPFDDAMFDAVISNGVIKLSVIKSRVFAVAVRVLRPRGRLASRTSSAASRRGRTPGATSNSESRASPARSRAAATSRRSRPPASTSIRCAATTTASSQSARSKPAAPTTCKASRSWAPRRRSTDRSTRRTSPKGSSRRSRISRAASVRRAGGEGKLYA